MQVQSGAIPEISTDFVFAIVGEEWGLMGSFLLLGLYAIIIFRAIRISQKSDDISGTLMSTGIVCCILFSILQNIGMTISITLPFISYGGSSVLTNFIQIGLILNIGMRGEKMLF